MRFFLPFWKTLSSDLVVLQLVSGVKIPFVCSIHQQCIPTPIRCSTREHAKIDSAIQRFIVTGVIEEVKHCTGEFIGNIFPVAKKNRDDVRIILNLKPLNPFIEYEHFKMEHLKAALTLISQNCFMGSVDLKDAYYSVNVDISCRKYLRFFWNDKLYQFTCLAQGISCAPRIFTKIMKPIFSHLRTRGYLSTYYLDDSLLIGYDYDSCLANLEATKDTLINAGFIINYTKSCFIPTKEITYLGFCINSVTMSVSLPAHKKKLILDLCAKFAKKFRFVLREVAAFIGILVSSLPAVQYGALHYRYLEKCKIDALSHACGNYDETVELSELARTEIKWWSDNINYSFRPILTPPPTVFIETDASLSGWGAHYKGQSTGGHWSVAEATLHINVLELKSILFSLQSFFFQVTGIHVRIQTDNSTAVCYINNFGGVKSIDCHAITKEIWLWALDRKIFISAEHLAGSLNVHADKASRVFDENTEWQIDPIIINKLTNIFGKFDIDLFASRLNTHCEKYCSWRPDPKAMFIDAFSRNWNNFAKPYLFPPFSVITTCLQKISQDLAQVIFVAPLWPTQVWFPKMMHMLIAPPIILPLGILQLPFKPEAVHKQAQSLRLMVCHLSGKPTDNEEFRKKLSRSSVHPGVIPLNHNIQSMLKTGFVSVVEGKLIPCSIMR